MSLRISFDLDDDDLKHFRLIMREARKAVAQKSPEDIVAAAAALMHEIGVDTAPGFIVERLKKLDMMMQMITDVEWRLPHEETKRVLNALAYFAEPDDLIPDHIPGLGFLDDAIMVELVVRELRHELEAYQDFSEFRERESSRATGKGHKQLQNRLEARRAELHSRMRRRRQRSLERNAQSGLRLLD
ncbi:MAG: YkvA family protein [Woeseiaceae bacterium]